MNGPWVHITVEYTTSTANFCPFSLSNSFLRACMTRQHVSRKKAARKLLRFESLAVAWLFSLRVTHVDNWPINCLVSQNKNLSSRGHSGFLRVIACDKTWFRPYWGSSAWHSHQSVAGENPCIKTLSCWSESFKSLHTTQQQFSLDMRREGGSWVWCMCARWFNLSFENSELNSSTA